MGFNKKHSKNKNQKIQDTFNREFNCAEDYVKAASFLAFSGNEKEAVELLTEGLVNYPNSEEIIRATFSFLCQGFNVLDALYFAEGHTNIFSDDQYSNITKAIDLVRLSLNFDAPKNISEKMVMEVDQILYLYSEEDTYDVPMITIGLMEEYHLPFVGLGIAKHLADDGNDFAQMVIGGSYLKGDHVKKNLNKAVHYLELSAQQGNKEALSLLEKAKTKADFN